MRIALGIFLVLAGVIFLLYTTVMAVVLECIFPLPLGAGILSLILGSYYLFRSVARG